MEGELFYNQLLDSGDVFNSYIDVQDINIVWVKGYNGKSHPINRTLEYNSNTRWKIKKYLGVRGRKS